MAKDRGTGVDMYSAASSHPLGDKMQTIIEYILCYSTAFFLGMAAAFFINIIIAKYDSSH